VNYLRRVLPFEEELRRGKANYLNRILMVIIKFQDGTDWFKANWVFRQFTEDIVGDLPNDTALRLLLEKAQAFGGLFFDSMVAESATPTLEAMRRVAEEYNPREHPRMETNKTGG